jgi:uncharacterized protein (TIGR02147 family)
MINIFEYRDYKTFLKEKLKTMGHGAQAKLSEAINCQPAYISQVLNRTPDLSLEQAADTAEFLELSKAQQDFFLLLVQHDRAGSERLKKIFKVKIAELIKSRALVSNRISGTDILDENTKAKYYSRWYYAAIHVLVSVESLGSRDAICEHLGLRKEIVNEALDFLLKDGLIREKSTGEFTVGMRRLFLEGDSPYIIQHHANWRLRAIETITQGGEGNIHFSSLYGLSKTDFERIKESLLSQLVEIRELVKPSPEEMVCVLNLDLFSLEKCL